MKGDPATRFRIALELHDLGVRMQRQRLRREHPDWTDAQLREAMRAWMLERPGAEHGDAVGTPSTRLR